MSAVEMSFYVTAKVSDQGHTYDSYQTSGLSVA